MQFDLFFWFSRRFVNHITIRNILVAIKTIVINHRVHDSTVRASFPVFIKIKSYNFVNYNTYSTRLTISTTVLTKGSVIKMETTGCDVDDESSNIDFAFLIDDVCRSWEEREKKLECIDVLAKVEFERRSRAEPEGMREKSDETFDGYGGATIELDNLIMIDFDGGLHGLAAKESDCPTVVTIEICRVADSRCEILVYSHEDMSNNWMRAFWREASWGYTVDNGSEGITLIMTDIIMFWQPLKEALFRAIAVVVKRSSDETV